MSIKRTLAGAANAVLSPVGLEIRRKVRSQLPPSQTAAPRSSIVTTDSAGRRSFMLRPDFADYVVDELAEHSFATFTAVLRPEMQPTRDQLAEFIHEFIDLYHDRPLPVNSHGGGFNNCLWVFLSARVLKPTLVIESGAMRGQSAWVLRMAAPNAVQHCFDIDLSRLVYRNQSIQYHEHDWNSFDFGTVDPDKSMIFFDDHISHQKRVLEARQKGFRHLVLDDNLPIYQLCKEGGAQVSPTLDMIFDAKLTQDTPIQNVCCDRDVETVYSPQDAAPARQAVAAWQNFPQAYLDRFNMKSRISGESKVALCRLAEL